MGGRRSCGKGEEEGGSTGEVVRAVARGAIGTRACGSHGGVRAHEKTRKKGEDRDGRRVVAARRREGSRKGGVRSPRLQRPSRRRRGRVSAARGYGVRGERDKRGTAKKGRKDGAGRLPGDVRAEGDRRHAPQKVGEGAEKKADERCEAVEERQQVGNEGEDVQKVWRRGDQARRHGDRHVDEKAEAKQRWERLGGRATAKNQHGQLGGGEEAKRRRA